jgi:hypothetical protein
MCSTVGERDERRHSGLRGGPDGHAGNEPIDLLRRVCLHHESQGNASDHGTPGDDLLLRHELVGASERREDDLLDECLTSLGVGVTPDFR